MTVAKQPSSKGRNIPLLLAGLTTLTLALSVPVSLQYAREHDGFYLVSSAFFADIPERLTGPGRFRFILQPVIAILLGLRAGLADARAGLPPYLAAVLFHGNLRRGMMKSGFLTVVNLLLMGILMDSVCQWLILGISYPGAALVVGSLLIVGPYSLSRSLTNRFVRRRDET